MWELCWTIHTGATMPNRTTAKLIGSALIVSDDAMATRHLTEALQELALSVEVCIKVAAGLDRVERTKLEVGVIDFGLGDMAPFFLEKMRASASNRTAVTFAITSGSAETARALKAGSTFCVGKAVDAGLDPAHAEGGLRSDCAGTAALLPLCGIGSGRAQPKASARNLWQNREREREWSIVYRTNSAAARYRCHGAIQLVRA
jgi:CheY-like chemotaxis protein